MRHKKQKDGIVYISGPIATCKDWRQRFKAAYDKLKADGWGEVQNPVDIGDGLEMMLGVVGKVPDYADYMKADLRVLLGSTHIYMLKGWQGSRGACLEKLVAEACGMEVLYEDDNDAS